MTVAWFLAYLVLIFVGDSGRRSDGNLSIVPPASWETTAIVTVHHDGMLDDCDFEDGAIFHRGFIFAFNCFVVLLSC